MRRLAFPLVAFAMVACATQEGSSSRFSEPNALMGEEIRNRIEQIPFQHREELFHNLLWLAQAGEQAIPDLLAALRSQDTKVRSNAVWVLGQIGDRRIIPDLRRLTQDQDRTVRLETSRTLMLLGDIQRAPTLIEALDSDKVQVRYLCHEALKTATGQDFGFDHLNDDLSQRRRSVLEWREWWTSMSGDSGFSTRYAARHGLSNGTRGVEGWAASPSPAPLAGAPAPEPTHPPAVPMTEIAAPAIETPPSSTGTHAATPPETHGNVRPGWESQPPQPRTRPDRISPERISPERTSPERTSPERTSPERTSPERTSPERTSPERTSPEPESPASPEGTSPAPANPWRPMPQPQSERPQMPDVRPMPVAPSTMAPAAEQGHDVIDFGAPPANEPEHAEGEPHASAESHRADSGHAAGEHHEAGQPHGESLGHASGESHEAGQTHGESHESGEGHGASHESGESHEAPDHAEAEGIQHHESEMPESPAPAPTTGWRTPHQGHSRVEVPGEHQPPHRR
ncbi:MAG: HEAT repeat domain-containing protein [Planctomycetota bacterium]